MDDKPMASGLTQKGRRLYAMYEKRFGAKQTEDVMDWRQRNPDDWWMDDAGGIWDLQKLPPYPSEPAYAEEVYEPAAQPLPAWMRHVPLACAVLFVVGFAWVCKMVVEAR